MLIAVKEVNLVARFGSVEHPLFGVVVIGAIPLKNIVSKRIVILLVGVSFVTSDEQNYLVVLGWGYDASGYSLKPSIPPKRGELVA
jgi:hypothetical protein